MDNEIFTVGHSTQSSAQFMSLLQKHGITAVADVRSAPYSQRNPHFNREELRAALKATGIKYVFLGKELGARSEDECCYVDGKVQYGLLAKMPLFQEGIVRVIDGAAGQRIALMCAEKDPLDCHRTILVGRELVKQGCRLTHILSGGALESHENAMGRLIARLGIEGDDMFRSQAMTLDEAYETQSARIAYDRHMHHAGSPGRNAVAESEGQ